MPSPIKNHHDKKNILQDDGSSIQVSSSDLQKRGVDAIKSQMLKNNPPGSKGRRDVYDKLDWKYDNTIPKTFGEKVSDFASTAKKFVNKNKFKLADAATGGLFGVAKNVVEKLKQ